METALLPVSPDSLQRAAALLQAGQIVGMPTETVYGLAANAADPEAVARIFTAKGRPSDNPLIVHIAELSALPQLADPPALAYKLAKAFWPGAMTMVLPRRDTVPDCVTAGLDTVGIRMPSHPAAAALIRKSGLALAAPSGNRSGSPSPATAAQMLADMDGRIPMILDGGPCEVGVESTVILVREDSVRLLRPGGVTADDLREFCLVEVDDGVLHPLADGEAAASPGMKYRHYAPAAEVTLVTGTAEAFAEFVTAHTASGVAVMASREELPRLPGLHVPFGRQGDPESQARELFTALRRCDELGAETVYVHCPPKRGIGLAVYNRLLRAAAFREIVL